MSDYWLRDYILSSEKRGFCIKRVCTTCGSLTFKAGVLRRLGLNARLHLPVPRDREVWSAVARELAQKEDVAPSRGAFDGIPIRYKESSLITHA
jgi:hypothetical protein